MQTSPVRSAAIGPAFNPSSSSIQADDLPLDQIAANSQLTQPQKIKQVSRAFEAVLLRQILREGQSPVFKSKLSGNSAADGIYRDLAAEQLADAISKSGSFGLAKSLSSNLQSQLPSSAAPLAPQKPLSLPLCRSPFVAPRSSQKPLSNSKPLSQPLSKPLSSPMSRPMVHPLSRPMAHRLSRPISRPLSSPPTHPASKRLESPHSLP